MLPPGLLYASPSRSAACLSAQCEMLLSGRAWRPNVKMAVAAPRQKYLRSAPTIGRRGEAWVRAWGSCTLPG